MFAPCPHCQFLISLHSQTRQPPTACPRCGYLLSEHDGELVATAPTSVQAATPAAPPATEAAAPRFARLPASFTGAPRRWQWLLLAALALLLPLQVVLADRARLAADARWRPLVSALCGVLHCRIPDWREPTALTMLDRQVRPVPDLPGALQVQATFRNDARWPQPWPVLQLTLSDADGRVLGSRAFQPQQYLGVGTTPGTLAPGQSGQASFLVREPAATTAAFTFDFH